MKRTPRDKKRMSDIAALAGVSPSTVSRALSGSPLVNERTRERIASIAQEYHYVINRQAQALRLQSSQTVAVMIPIDHEPNQHVSDPFFLEMLGAIADRLTETGFELLLSRVSASQWTEHLLRNGHVDGIIVIGQSIVHDKLNDYADHAERPIVVWGAHTEDQHYITVGSDNLEGGRVAAQHLLERGVKRPAILGDIELPEVSQRYAGFREVFTGVGIDPHVIPASFTPESGSAAMSRFLDSGGQLDGLFAASDLLASRAVRALGERGLKVPKDVAICGYDDISLAAFMSPAVTTVSQHIRRGAEALVDRIFQMRDGEPVESLVMEPSLVVRET